MVRKNTATAKFAFLAAIIGIAPSADGQEFDDRVAAHLLDLGTQVSLNYATCVVEHECPVVLFTCKQNEPPEVWLTALTSDQIVPWLFSAQYEEGPQPTAELDVDGIAYRLAVDELSYGGGGDMFSNWWVKLTPPGRWLEAFGAAEETFIRTPLFEIPLPSTQDDRDARSAFAEACLAL